MAWTEVILPILLAIVAASPGVLALLRGRGKERADTSAVFTGAAKALVEEYRLRADELEEEYKAKIDGVEEKYKSQLAEIEKTVREQAEKIVSQGRTIAQQTGEIDLQRFELQKQGVRIQNLEQERDEIMKGVQALCTQIRNLGHEPVWEPKPKG